MLKQSKKSRELQKKIGQILSFIPLSPNQWTAVAVIVAVVAAYEIAVGELVNGLVLFVLAGALDMVDGAVARARGEITKLGGFLDGISDRLVEALFLFSLMFYPLPTIWIDPKIWLAGLIFLGTCMPSYVRAYADHNEVISHEKAKALGGIFERSERILLLAIGMLAGIFISMDYFVYAVILAIVLSLVTVAQRIGAVMEGG
jgi:phosphatidylglycerophosphate synthase